MILLSACYRKTTCPAFQSKYILDEDVLRQKYSLFDIESNPKDGIGMVKKNKYGIHSNKSYQVKFNQIKNVDMVTIYPDNQDATLLASLETDSLYADSVMVPSSRYLTTFNNEQLIYNTLFGSLRKPEIDGMELFRKDLEVEKNEEIEDKEEKVGFFKRIFGGKKKKRKEKKEAERAEFGEPYEEDQQPPAGEENGDDF
jgi:hypothetical protein